MILTGKEIIRQMGLGSINITPFKESRINPNSYNGTLSNQLKVYKQQTLSTKKKPELLDIITIDPQYGYTLYPGNGYLGCSIETTFCKGYVPRVDGRSSVGRLFVLVHCTAGFGDNGFHGQWTLELVALAMPVTIFAGDELFQISFEPTIGEGGLYEGRYQHQQGPVESRIWQGTDFPRPIPSADLADEHFRDIEDKENHKKILAMKGIISVDKAEEKGDHTIVNVYEDKKYRFATKEEAERFLRGGSEAPKDPFKDEERIFNELEQARLQYEKKYGCNEKE